MATPYKTIAFQTLGCKLNYSETSTLARKCSKYGYVKGDSIRILERSIGKINTTHFTGNVIFDIKLLLRIFF